MKDSNGMKIKSYFAKSVDEAIAKAYQAVDKIHFEGAQFRTDIGAKGLAKLLPAGESPRG